MGSGKGINQKLPFPYISTSNGREGMGRGDGFGGVFDLSFKGGGEGYLSEKKGGNNIYPPFGNAPSQKLLK